MAGLTVGFQSKDADGTASNAPINKWSLSYAIGDVTANYSADDRTGADRDWDASVVYAMGATTVTLQSSTSRITTSTTTQSGHLEHWRRGGRA